MTDDPELDELVRANRRRAGLRLLGVGVLVGACSGAVMVYGMSLDDAYEGSEVHFLLSDRLAIAGAIGLVIGLLLVIPGAISLVRSRRRPPLLPRAQVRE